MATITRFRRNSTGAVVGIVTHDPSRIIPIEMDTIDPAFHTIVSRAIMNPQRILQVSGLLDENFIPKLITYLQSKGLSVVP